MFPVEVYSRKTPTFVAGSLLNPLSVKLCPSQKLAVIVWGEPLVVVADPTGVVAVKVIDGVIVVIDNDHPFVSCTKSRPRSSTRYKLHVPFALKPLNTFRSAAP